MQIKVRVLFQIKLHFILLQDNSNVYSSHLCYTYIAPLCTLPSPFLTSGGSSCLPPQSARPAGRRYREQKLGGGVSKSPFTSCRPHALLTRAQLSCSQTPALTHQHTQTNQRLFIYLCGALVLWATSQT